MEITSGFLVVKRFEALYKEFAAKPDFCADIHALPLAGTGPERLAVRYRGLDRDAVSPDAKGSLAEIRLFELRSESYDGTNDFLFRHVDALDVLRWVEDEASDVYEIAWTCVAGAPASPPAGFRLLGYEPTYFTSDHFSAIRDCMCFPRWHGTDNEGVLFRPYFERLNPNGLFDDPAEASAFLAHYRSFDWTETGDYEIAAVWAE